MGCWGHINVPIHQVDHPCYSLLAPLEGQALQLAGWREGNTPQQTDVGLTSAGILGRTMDYNILYITVDVYILEK